MLPTKKEQIEDIVLLFPDNSLPGSNDPKIKNHSAVDASLTFGLICGRTKLVFSTLFNEDYSTVALQLSVFHIFAITIRASHIHTSFLIPFLSKVLRRALSV